MRAKRVNETLSFRKGLDPKRSIGIGIPYDAEAFRNYIISRLPEILEVENIPRDIISRPGFFINPKYSKYINPYLENLLKELGVDPYPENSEPLVDTDSTLGYNIWSILYNYLETMGYSTS